MQINGDQWCNKLQLNKPVHTLNDPGKVPLCTGLLKFFQTWRTELQILSPILWFLNTLGCWMHRGPPAQRVIQPIGLWQLISIKTQFGPNKAPSITHSIHFPLHLHTLCDKQLIWLTLSPTDEHSANALMGTHLIKPRFFRFFLPDLQYVTPKKLNYFKNGLFKVSIRPANTNFNLIWWIAFGSW